MSDATIAGSRASPQISRCGRAARYRQACSAAGRIGREVRSSAGSPGSSGARPSTRLSISAIEKPVMLDIEVQVELSELLEFLCQQLLVPAGIERELVVGDHIGPLLRRASCVSIRRQGTVSTQELRSRNPAMTGEDHVLAVDQDRVGEAKAADAVGDLSDLFFRMRSRVVGPGPKWADCDGLQFGRPWAAPYR